MLASGIGPDRRHLALPASSELAEDCDLRPARVGWRVYGGALADVGSNPRFATVMVCSPRPMRNSCAAASWSRDRFDEADLQANEGMDRGQF